MSLNQEKASKVALNMSASVTNIRAPISASLPRIIKRKPVTYIHPFTYISLLAGIGLLVMGSVLTYIFQDMSRYFQDSFRHNLQMTAYLFMIIGVLFITSSLIKIVCMLAILLCECKPDTDPICCLWEDDASVENDIEAPTLIPENTILYNPNFPPVLIPYDFNKGEYVSRELSESISQQPNISFFPGNLIIPEQNNLKKEAGDFHRCDDSDTDNEPREKIFVLEDHKEENVNPQNAYDTDESELNENINKFNCECNEHEKKY